MQGLFGWLKLSWVESFHLIPFWRRIRRIACRYCFFTHRHKINKELGFIIIVYSSDINDSTSILEHTRITEIQFQHNSTAAVLNFLYLSIRIQHFHALSCSTTSHFPQAQSVCRSSIYHHHTIRRDDIKVFYSLLNFPRPFLVSFFG